MLQINIQPYASDALEDAMQLAQTKALNSYTFSDCMNYLNYAWSDMYNALALVDEGFYSKNQRITKRLTPLPPYVKNSVKVYSAQSVVGGNRTEYIESGYSDMQMPGTFHISGFDLYCPDAERRTVWLNYVPQPPMLFFTHRNRDPKLYTATDDIPSKGSATAYGMYTLVNGAAPTATLTHNNVTLGITIPIGEMIAKEGYSIVFIRCDFPYIFVTYQNTTYNDGHGTGEYLSGFYRDIVNAGAEFVEYNPFAYQGRNSNVEYKSVSWNDKTGMGVVVADHNDGGQLKELGWTPDTQLSYPCPEMYRLLVAKLADKFAALNESNIMGVQKELMEAQYAFNAFCSKNKAAWRRIANVTPANMSDWL